MNYLKAIEKYLGRKFDSFNEAYMTDNHGEIGIVWNITEKKVPTIQQLETLYNNNKTEIDNEIEKENLINEHRKRIINKLVENELIKEGLL